MNCVRTAKDHSALYVITFIITQLFVANSKHCANEFICIFLSCSVVIAIVLVTVPYQSAILSIAFAFQ